jgi:DNA modification methylase
MINLMLGDCLERMKEIPAGTVDLVLCDPPYGTTMCKWDSVINLELMWCQLKRVIKSKGAIVLMAQTPFDKILGASNVRMLKHEWIWEKTNATGFLNAKKMPLKAHENALVFSDDESDHWNMMVFYGKLPSYDPQMTHGHERKTAKRKVIGSECYGKALNLTNYDSTSRYPRSVIKFPSDKQKNNLHPTQKPVALMEYLIKTYTKESETVLDFTMGSGSTGVAAKNLNRDFIGIEMDEGYFKIAQDRIENA